MHPEHLLHDMIQRLQTPTQSNSPVTLREFAEMQYRAGKISHIPTKQPLTREEHEARERRAKLYSGGKPPSETIIEDRGGNINAYPRAICKGDSFCLSRTIISTSASSAVI